MWRGNFVPSGGRWSIISRFRAPAARTQRSAVHLRGMPQKSEIIRYWLVIRHWRRTLLIRWIFKSKSHPTRRVREVGSLRGTNDRRSATAFASSRDQEAIYSTCLEVFRPRSRS